MRFTGILLGGLGFVAVYFNSVHASENRKVDISLIIKPNICIAGRGEPACESSMNISWESEEVGDYCLHSALSEGALACWDLATSGRYQDRVILNDDVMYWMAYPGTQEKLVTNVIKFAALKPHRKFPRRRSRLPWSLVGP